MILEILMAVAAIALIVILTVLLRRPTDSAPLGLDLSSVQNNIGALTAHVAEIRESQREVHTNVVALVSNPGKRGAWGELTLLRLLEGAGMKRGVDYDVQASNGDGRPDVVIHLGGGNEVVVDSKVPVVHLKNALDAEDDNARREHIKLFADAVRQYARDLSKRDYSMQLEATFAPVVMYIPIDGAWEAAREMREDILSEMMRLKIYPAEPSTMGAIIAVLRQVALIAGQDEVVEAVLSDARKLADAVRVMGGHLARLGKGLGSSVDGYNKLIGSIDRTLLPAASRMAEHFDLEVGETTTLTTMADTGRADALKTKMDAA